MPDSAFVGYEHTSAYVGAAFAYEDGLLIPMVALPILGCDACG
ncbi:hypothetical protein [Bifidobacterium psychraerophilum]